MEYCALFQTDFIELRKPSFSFPRMDYLFQWSNPFRTLNYHGRRQPAFIIIWTLLFIGYFPAMQTEHVSSRGEFWPSSERNEPECATCARERTLSVLKDEEIKRWRIETTKKQILDRLDMEDRPPRVKTKDGHFHGLPPIAIHLPDDSPAEPEVEPARQIILFPEKIFRRSKLHSKEDAHNANKTSTLKFHITNEMNESALHSAVLWTPQTPPSPPPPPAYNSTSTVDWHAVDVTWTVDRQLEHRQRSLSLALDATDAFQVNQPRPYLVVQLDPSVPRWPSGSSTRTTRRRKRQTTPLCSSTVTQCCRDSLYISFKDVGWNDWIIAPEGFQAYYCRGSCRTMSAPATGATSHASLLQNLLARDRAPPAARPHLAPCCAPTRLSSLSVFYSDENNVIKQRTLPNMIVESCGCAL